MSNAGYSRCIARMIKECNEMHPKFIAEYDPRDSGAVNINTFHVIMFPRGSFEGAGYELFITVPELNSKEDADDISVMFKKNIFHPLISKKYPFNMCVSIKTSQIIGKEKPLGSIMEKIIKNFSTKTSWGSEMTLNPEAASMFAKAQTYKEAMALLIKQGMLES